MSSKVERALISVSDKRDVETFARALKGIDGPATLYRVPVSALTGSGQPGG